MSNDLLEKTDALLASVEIPDRSTFFQLKNFIIGSEPTVHGQIWACLRNIQERRENYEMLQLQIEDLEDDLELQHINKMHFLAVPQPLSETEEVALMHLTSPIQARKIDRQVQSIQKNINKLKNKLKYIKEEMEFLTTALDQLVKANGGKIDPLDNYEAQQKYWNTKLTEELNLCFVLNRPVNAELVKTIVNLQDDLPVKRDLFKILENAQKRTIAQLEKMQSGGSDIISG